MSLHDRVSALPDGGRALAVSRLRRSVLKVLHRAFSNSSLESQVDLAKRLKVRRSAVNQVFRGDGNVRISTLAEYLYEMGYELDITLVKAGEIRDAALQDRAPTPAFPTASASASVTYGTYAWKAPDVAHILCATTPYAWSNLVLIDACANAAIGVSEIGVTISDDLVYSALNMSPAFTAEGTAQ